MIQIWGEGARLFRPRGDPGRAGLGWARRGSTSEAGRGTARGPDLGRHDIGASPLAGWRPKLPARCPPCPGALGLGRMLPRAGRRQLRPIDPRARPGSVAPAAWLHRILIAPGPRRPSRSRQTRLLFARGHRGRASAGRGVVCDPGAPGAVPFLATRPRRPGVAGTQLEGIPPPPRPSVLRGGRWRPEEGEGARTPPPPRPCLSLPIWRVTPRGARGRLPLLPPPPPASPSSAPGQRGAVRSRAGRACDAQVVKGEARWGGGGAASGPGARSSPPRQAPTVSSGLGREHPSSFASWRGHYESAQRRAVGETEARSAGRGSRAPGVEGGGGSRWSRPTAQLRSPLGAGRGGRRFPGAAKPASGARLRRGPRRPRAPAAPRGAAAPAAQRDPRPRAARAPPPFPEGRFLQQLNT